MAIYGAKELIFRPTPKPPRGFTFKQRPIEIARDNTSVKTLTLDSEVIGDLNPAKVEGKDNRHEADDDYDDAAENKKLDALKKQLKGEGKTGTKTGENTKGIVDKQSVEGAAEQVDGLKAKQLQNPKPVEKTGKSDQNLKHQLKKRKIDE